MFPHDFPIIQSKMNMKYFKQLMGNYNNQLWIRSEIFSLFWEEEIQAMIPEIVFRTI